MRTAWPAEAYTDGVMLWTQTPEHKGKRRTEPARNALCIASANTLLDCGLCLKCPAPSGYRTPALSTLGQLPASWRRAGAQTPKGHGSSFCAHAGVLPPGAPPTFLFHLRETAMAQLQEHLPCSLGACIFRSQAAYTDPIAHEPLSR